MRKKETMLVMRKCRRGLESLVDKFTSAELAHVHTYIHRYYQCNSTRCEAADLLAGFNFRMEKKPCPGPSHRTRGSKLRTIVVYSTLLVAHARITQNHHRGGRHKSRVLCFASACSSSRDRRLLRPTTPKPRWSSSICVPLVSSVRHKTPTNTEKRERQKSFSIRHFCIKKAVVPCLFIEKAFFSTILH